MAKICREAETARNSYKYYQSVCTSLSKPFEIPETIASAAVQAAFEQHASAMIVLTNSNTIVECNVTYDDPKSKRSGD